MWEQRLAEAKQAIMEGKLFIPSWWKLEYKVEFAKYLKEKGWKPVQY